MPSPDDVRAMELAAVAEQAASAVLKAQEKSEDRIMNMVREVAKEAAKEATTEVASKVATESAMLAAAKAVTETLVTLGLDPKDRDKIVRNFIFLDDAHGMYKSVLRHAILAVIGIVMAGIVSAVWFSIKTKI